MFAPFVSEIYPVAFTADLFSTMTPSTITGMHEAEDGSRPAAAKASTTAVVRVSLNMFSFHSTAVAICGTNSASLVLPNMYNSRIHSASPPQCQIGHNLETVERQA